MKDQPYVETSPKVSGEIKKTTCYMCACRCGIDVHIKDGKVAYIEGNKDHPVNQGVLCAKGSAGIMQVNAPSRLDSPMKRVGPRGSGEFKKISWDEALNLAVEWLKPLRKKTPEKLAFFTGRDQSQSFTSYFAQMFGTPNYAAHGGFVALTWLQLEFIQWVVHFGNLGNLIGTIQNYLYCLGWQKIMIATRLKWELGKSKNGEQRLLALTQFVLGTMLLLMNG